MNHKRLIVSLPGCDRGCQGSACPALLAKGHPEEAAPVLLSLEKKKNLLNKILLKN